MSMDVNPASEASEKEYEAPPVVRAEHSEDSFTRLLEQQTAKVPSHVFLFSSFCAMAASLGLGLIGRGRAGRFGGLWVTPLLAMGVDDKLVKTLGPR